MAKSTNKILKFVLVTAGILVGLMIVGMIGVAAYIHVKYPPAVMKSMATEKLSTLLHHKVSVGNVVFNMLTGFKINDLKINNRDGWADKPMVVAKDISISYHLYGLIMGYFAGQIQLGEIRLDSPQILVERRGLGQFNFTDMAGESTSTVPAPNAASVVAPKAKGKSKAKPKAKKKGKRHAAIPTEQAESTAFSFSFVDQVWAETSPVSSANKTSSSSLLISVDSININHGKMTYLDETSSPAQRSELKDLNLKIKNISMAGGKTTFSLDTPFTYSNMNYQLAVDGAFHYYLAGQALKGIDVKGTVNGLGFNFSGDALDMASNFAPNMDGQASLNMLQFSGLVPKSLSSMPTDLTLTGPAKVDFHLGGKVKNGLELSGIADGSELAIKYKDLFVKTAKSVCKVDFKSVISPDGSYDLPSYKVLYQDWEVTGAFHHKNNAPWSAEAHSKALPFKGLPGMLPKLKNTTIDGSGSLDLSFVQVKGPLPFKTNGRIQIKGVGITLPQEPYLQEMNGPINVTDNVIKIPGITFKSFDGTGVYEFILNGNTQAYSYSFNLKNVSAQKAINASVDAYVTKNPSDYKDKFFGLMNFAYAGSGKGFSEDQMIANAAGSGNYSITNAKVKGFAVIKAVNKYFKDQSDEMPFDQIAGNLVMKNKVFSYTANTNGKVGAIREAGAINVADMIYASDMKIQYDVKKEFLNSDSLQAGLPDFARGLLKNPDWLSDDKGNVPLDVKFTGKVKDNNYSYDWSRLTQNLKAKAGKELQKAAQDTIQKVAPDLGSKLKGLFGQ